MERITTPETIKDLIFGQRLHLVTGKGGVGKSVISISLAIYLKKIKKRVLLAQMSPIESEYDEKSEIFMKIRKRLPPIDYIYIEPRSALEEYGLMVLKFKRLYKLIFEDKMVKSSIKAMPSLSFLLLIGKLWYYCTLKDKKGDYIYDYIVVDAPSTGMAISMLNLPHIINDASPDGPLRERALDIEKMLTDKDTTSVHIVTTCEETPVNEAIEIYNAISRRLSIKFGTLFVNKYESIADEEFEYINQNISSVPEVIRNCVEKRILENRYKETEFNRLLMNIPVLERRVITIPPFNNNFDIVSIINDIVLHLENSIE